MVYQVRGIVEEVELGKPFDVHKDDPKKRKKCVNMKIKIQGTNYTYKFAELANLPNIEKGTFLFFEFTEEEKEWQDKKYTERAIIVKSLQIDNDAQNHPSHPTTQPHAPKSIDNNHPQSVSNQDKVQALIVFQNALGHATNIVKEVRSNPNETFAEEVISVATGLANAAYNYVPHVKNNKATPPVNKTVINAEDIQDDDIPF
jgi:hypothetical protein